jgi:hypothetical protein
MAIPKGSGESVLEDKEDFLGVKTKKTIVAKEVEDAFTIFFIDMDDKGDLREPIVEAVGFSEAMDKAF